MSMHSLWSRVWGNCLCCLVCRLTFTPIGVLLFFRRNWSRRVARGGRWGQLPPPIPKVAPKIFRLIKLMCKPKKYFSANKRNCLRNLSYFSLQLNLITAVWFTNCLWLINRCVHGCRKDFTRVGALVAFSMGSQGFY